MKKFICVYDFETDGQNPLKCQPVQLAGLMLHPITLEIADNSEFCIDMRPEDIDEEGYLENSTKSFQGKTVKDTVQWHANNYECTPEEILEKWRSAPDQATAWKQWTSYLKKWNANQKQKTMWHAPIRAGHNIRNFDNKIIDRMCDKYNDVNKDGNQKIFYPRDVVDIQEMAFYWFENQEEPAAYNMEALREYFGLEQHGAHDAINDVRDEAWMISRFLKLHRSQAPRVKFKGSALQHAV